MRGVGIVFSQFLDVDIELGVGIGMAVVFMYAVLGGMKGNHLYAGGTVLRLDLRLSRSSVLHLYTDYRHTRAATRFWRAG